MNEEVADDSGENDFLLIEFLAIESFVGSIQAGPVVLRMSAYSADHMGIAKGKLFLVYAYKPGTGKVAGIDASFTKLAEKAGAELTFLRGLDKDNPASWMFGTVNLVAKSSLFKDSRQRYPSLNLEIRRDDEAKFVEATTDADGNYLLEGLEAGWYRITAKLPNGMNLVSEGGQGTLVKHGCMEANVDVKYANKLSGRILDAAGKPLSKVPLELIPVNYFKPRYDVYHHEESTPSNDDGSFTFFNVPSGKYILAVNYTFVPEFESPFPTNFYPGTLERSKAELIDIQPGKEIEGLKFVLGPERLGEKSITGRVVFPDGSPASNTRVYLKEDENQTCCVLENVKTDSKGNFTLVGFISRKYRVWTFIDHKPFSKSSNFVGASPVFTLDNATPSFRLVLNPTKMESLDAIDLIERRERGLK